MKFIISCCCALAVLAASAEVSDCYVRMTVTEYTNLVSQVSTLWTAHTNRIASIKRHKERQEKQAALQKVRENVKKHKSAMGKSSGGVKK